MFTFGRPGPDIHMVEKTHNRCWLCEYNPLMQEEHLHHNFKAGLVLRMLHFKTGCNYKSINVHSHTVQRYPTSFPPTEFLSFFFARPCL